MSSPFSRTSRSLSSDTSQYALLTWLLALILLLAWLAWFFFGKVTVYEISRQARLEVERSVHPVAAMIAGKVVSSRLLLGQEVKAGDVLIELDASSEKLRLREEESRLKALPPQIAALQREIADLGEAMAEDHQAALSTIQAARFRHKEAVAAAEFAKENELRLAELSSSGRIAVIDSLRAHSESQKLHAVGDALSSEIGQVEMDAKTRVHQKKAEIENLKRAMVTLNGQVETSQAAIALLRQDIEKHLIRAPADGQVGDAVPLQVGAYVAEGGKLGTVVPPGKLKIVAYFNPTAVLGRIHPGQFSRMRLDGFPWAQYGSIQAKVSRVATEIRENQVSVEFVPEFSAESGILMQHGLPGSIEVSVEQVAPAVLILRSTGQALSASIPQTTQPNRP